MKPITEPFQSDVGVVLHLLERKHLDHTLAWRNDAQARRWFKNDALIEVEQHYCWFDRYLMKRDDLMFIAEIDGELIGQVSVYAIDRGQRQAEVGRFLAAPAHAGKGLMKRAIRALITLCRDELTLTYLFLEVKGENERAIRLYEALGFLAEHKQGELIRMGQVIRET
ncbi:GNAT family N-acetyltransferase [Pannonibacter phragmitetus]|uniref:GNAT family N-acetyltransferase n=1 Tax=Pannonibacter phragmitetus TaxID=121719 RepID=UPI000B97AFD7|nr:GNAT family N-acetyltransferase [Pannonibacter phragmitetus]